MKTFAKGFAYLEEGVEMLNELGFVAFEFAPIPTRFQDFDQWDGPLIQDSFDGIIDEIVNMLDRAMIPSKSLSSYNLPKTRPEAYFDLLNPFKFVFFGLNREILPDKSVMYSRMWDAVSGLALQHPETSSVVAAQRSEKLHSLIWRFNDVKRLALKLPLDARNPRAILLRGMSLLKESTGAQPDVFKLIWGVALFGWASLAIKVTKKCAYCPRKCFDGSKYCVQHSQSFLGVTDSSKSTQYVNYRIGKKALQLAAELGYVDGQMAQAFGFHIGPCSEMKEPLTTKVPHHLRTLAQIIFGTYRTWDCRLHGAIRMALTESPLVLAKVGGAAVFGMKYSEIVDLVRERLNLFEDDECNLAFAIFIFEHWLQCEEKVRCGVRGLGVKTQERIDKAVAMANQRNTRTEIARALNVAQSTVTLWAAKRAELSRELTRHVTHPPTERNRSSAL